MVTDIPSEGEFREGIREWFTSRAFRVEDVSEEDDEERADLLISDESIRVLLELKIKGENEVEEGERRSVLQKGGVHRYSESSLRRNRMSALITKGVSQLTTTPLQRDFDVLWLHGAGRYADHHGTRFIASLYGRRWLVPVSGQEGRYCYYFDNSEFFRHRTELCAAIISWGDEGLLCINDLHANANRFRESSFRAAFGDSCIDPPQAERAGEAYIPPADAPRGNVDAMLEAVATKYNVPRLIDFSPTMHIAEAAVGQDGSWPTGEKR
jgi:hypothetical protein